MVELGIPELTTEQIETLCSIAEDAARKYIFSKVSSKMVDGLNISVEAAGSRPLNVAVDIDFDLSPKVKGINAQTLVKEAAKEAHRAIENYLRNLE